VRKYGLTIDALVAADIVTADGQMHHVDAKSEPDLFWAIRGGGGNVGAITALELELFPIPEIYAGALLWPIERAKAILGAWREWVEEVPDECESLGRMLQLPDAPFLPDHLRGRSFVLLELAFIGGEAEGVALAQPLRDLGPEFDTVAMMPTSDLSLVHMDPDMPLPYSGEGLLLADLPPAAIDATVEAFVGSPLLHVEFRHLGGALGRESTGRGVLGAIEQPFLAFTFGLGPDEGALAAVEHYVGLLLERLGPWDSGRRYLNFAESRVDPRSIFPVEGYERLRLARARYDPTGLFRANHPVEDPR
jgi:hypothetical protein